MEKRRYSENENLIILNEVVAAVELEGMPVSSLRYGNLNNKFVSKVVDNIKAYEELSERTEGAIACQVGICSTGIYINNGKAWSEHTRAILYRDLYNLLK